MIKVNEIFHSIQGEGEHAGLPCVFVRLTYCNLRCIYCDTEYAFEEGEDMSIEDIISEVSQYDCNLVEVTGGEPLFQKESLILLKKLCNSGYEVLLETGGSLSIEEVDRRVTIIMDLKTPSSGMMKKNLYENIKYLKNNDQVKFVIGDSDDYDWTKETIQRYKIMEKSKILLSPIFGKIGSEELVNWILNDRLKVRFQLQLHKYIWDPEKRGV